MTFLEKLLFLVIELINLMDLNTPLLPEKFYHIYNRGINGEELFKQERNYAYFLNKYANYLEPVVETYAYCLLKNHFHLLIKVKQNITEPTGNLDLTGFENLSGLKHEKGLHHTDNLVSKKFSDLFNSYTKSINKACNRTGSLFETPFKRIEVTNDLYLTRLIWYIHHNPQKHGFVSDFRDYPYSSYHAHLSNKNTKLKRDDVIEWFGGMSLFKNFHTEKQNELNISHFVIEF
jgi:hypothetical protein